MNKRPPPPSYGHATHLNKHVTSLKTEFQIPGECARGDGNLFRRVIKTTPPSQMAAAQDSVISTARHRFHPDPDVRDRVATDGGDPNKPHVLLLARAPDSTRAVQGNLIPRWVHGFFASLLRLGRPRTAHLLGHAEWPNGGGRRKSSRAWERGFAAARTGSS